MANRIHSPKNKVTSWWLQVYTRKNSLAKILDTDRLTVALFGYNASPFGIQLPIKIFYIISNNVNEAVTREKR